MFSKKLKTEIKELKQREIELTKTKDGLFAKISELNIALEKIKESALKIEEERDKLKKMVRKQTEADLLINALRAIGIINIPKQELSYYFLQQQRFLAMQQQAQAMATSLRGYNPLSAVIGRALY